MKIKTFLIAGLFPVMAFAQVPTLIKDINLGSTGSTPSKLISLGSNFYFTATTPTEGLELYKSDGTTSGTSLVKDINPGSSNSINTSLQVLGTDLLFGATDAVSGSELWISDGTNSGTVLLKDINTGSGSSYPSKFTKLGTILLFTANDNINGSELWKTDGTSGGTVLVKDIKPGSSGSGASALYEMGSAVYFFADNGTNGYELWKSDGTAAGTTLLKDINPGAPGAFTAAPQGIRVLDNHLYFTANDGVNGYELWKTDGTEAGTVLVKDINPGPGNSSPDKYFATASHIYFTASDGTNGSELWKSDGTTAGTQLVKDINPGTVGCGCNGFIMLGSDIVFSASDGSGPGSNGIELWKSDGTSSGTILIKDINTGTANSLPDHFVLAGSELIFSATTASNGRELWKTDGTNIGTSLIYDLNPGAGNGIGSFIGGQKFLFSSPKLYFQGDDGTTGDELYELTTTVTTAGLQLNTVAQIDQNPNPASDYVLINNQEEFPVFLNVYDQLGALVFTSSAIDDLYTLDVATFNNGVYFLKYFTPDQQVIKHAKLIIAH